MIPGEEIDLEHLNELLERHKAFIIRIVSRMTGRYVYVEHDDEFSIALAAFAEAVERYEREKGDFLSFAKLVIESRLKTYFSKENRQHGNLSLEELQEKGVDFSDEEEEASRACLRDEIRAYCRELSYFGLDLEKLADTAPSHKDTRIRALGIAKKAGEDPPTVQWTYKKKRLPIRAVARLASVTEKIVKTSKTFILAAMVIVVKHFPALSAWIKEVGGVN